VRCFAGYEYVAFHMQRVLVVVTDPGAEVASWKRLIKETTEAAVAAASEAAGVAGGHDEL
jgi:hypothetical protein